MDVIAFRIPSYATEDVAPTPSRGTAGWPLIGDIVAMRGGVPEHLIQWRREEGASDPEPQL